MLTSKDVHEKKFATKLNGYSGPQVDLFLDQVAEALDGLHQKNADLTAELEKTQEQLAYLRSIEDTLRDTLVTAQKNANDVVADAREQAQKLLADAQNQGASILNQAERDAKSARADLGEIRKQIGEYARQVRQVMAGQLDIMEQYFEPIQAESETIRIEKGESAPQDQE